MVTLQSAKCLILASVQLIGNLSKELNGAMLAIETVFQRGWNLLWLENDSLLVIQAFRNPDLVPWKLTKR
ncbi:hypothetical protein D0Y65_048131 [Glycine soja]|uniref:RNase H type-1 domain-containing protein n=1 Tax=Glycine soja TaxID=3848 RepID=A0A445FRR0_GLYSO|nr:hypothetical protein D0Y65_048131 [Glycine soja]